jgi:cell division protein FtsI/penicillin-binding protein 2
MLSNRRIIVVAVAFSLLVLLVAGRTLYSQRVAFPNFEAAVSDQQTQPVNTIAPRGRIYDRNGNVLAVSNRAYLMWIDRLRVTRPEQVQHLANAIAPVLGRDPAALAVEIEQIVAGNANRVNSVAFAVPLGVVTRTQEAIDAYASRVPESGLDSLMVQPQNLWVRRYPFGPIGGPTVGFRSTMSDNATGVEAFADDALSERPGLRIGRARIDLIESKPTLSGADVVLTLDVNLQAHVEERLAQAIRDTGARAGQIIVMETRTGRILSSATFPGYDPNRVPELAADPITAGTVRDPAVTDTYEPGSVIKLCTMAAALDAGVVRPDQIFDDAGRIIVDGAVIRNSDGRAYGAVTLTDVLARSLNVVTVQIAQALGPEGFYNGMRVFGFGSRSGIDLYGEAVGVLDAPNTAGWSRQKFATSSFGQGMSVTPYQLINAVNAIGNDGMLMQPFVIQQWNPPDAPAIRKQPVPLQRAISSETARLMRSIMRDATMRATPEIAPEGYTVAGKTGTAQYYRDGRIADDTFVSYVGFLPADNPRVTILIKLDQPTSSTWANKTTIDVFHDVAEHSVRLLGVPPDNP